MHPRSAFARSNHGWIMESVLPRLYESAFRGGPSIYDICIGGGGDEGEIRKVAWLQYLTSDKVDKSKVPKNLRP